jgi:hydroxyacylglutathione hydrolase
MKAEVVRLEVGPLQTNCYLLADLPTGMAAVIDPGDEPWRISHELAMREWTLEKILITHAHFDHIAGCGELAEQCHGRIGLHPADLPLWWIRGYGEFLGIVIPELPNPSFSFSESEPVAVGNLSLEVLHLPGHSAGHVGFFLREKGWLFSGDVVFAGGGRGRTDLPGGDELVLQKTVIHKIWTLPEATVLYPGHGETTTVGEEKRLASKKTI